jgi:hypothetical protein
MLSTGGSPRAQRNGPWGAKMTVSKSIKPDLAGKGRESEAQETETEESRFAQKTPPREEAAMQMEASLKNAAGRLSREDQRRLGDILQRVYDDVIRQGVPDRFRDLLSELDGTSIAGQVEMKSSSSYHGQAGDVRAQGAGEHDQRLNHPGSKGSH